MPEASNITFTEFPPFDQQQERLSDKHDSPFESITEAHFGNPQTTPQTKMAGASPFIKPEPNDHQYSPHNFAPTQQGYNMGGQHNFNINGNPAGIDPMSITNSNGYNQGFGGQGMSSSFNMGGAGIADDELLDLAGSLGDTGNDFQGYNDNTMNQQNYFNNGMSVGQQQQMNNLYSHTPDGAPIQSPFASDFNYNQFRPNSHQQQQAPQAYSLPNATGFVNSGSLRAQQIQNMERKISESRSPATPNTPGLGGLHLGEPEYPHPNVQQQIMNHRHSTSISNNWDSTPSGGHSWNESSPFASPKNGHAIHHPQISEILRSGGHGKVASSLPTKMEPGLAPGPPFQTQEAKKRRRRESHNLVERRRRDNINERIHDLGNLVPQHRLEDEKVRKHLQTNSPLSPSMTATGMSPPAATSGLAGSAGRRAAGSITQGLPLEDKDKGPNKGDILNSSVAWAKDVLWFMHMKLEQEAQLEDLVTSLGGVWPFQRSENEKRMRSEILEVVERNIQEGGLEEYSRANGTGLRVPNFTNVAGDALQAGAHNDSMSPGYQTGSSGNQFWHPNLSNGGFKDFKEEDEFDDEML